MSLKATTSITESLMPNTFPIYLKLALSIIIITAITFSIYVWSEKQIDLANDLRMQSHQLTDALRQSSDDLTRMVRTYIATGNPIYKEYYQNIIDIRNGNMPRPKNYHGVYWDFVLTGKIQANADNTQAIALLDLMKQAGFSKQELQKLSKSKSHSDKLTEIELKAMTLFESSVSNGKSKALSMLYDDNYHLAKADIMNPIKEVTMLVDERTSHAIAHAKKIALTMLMVFIGFVLAVIFILLRLYSLLKNQLGGSLKEVQNEITKIGSADFASTIHVPLGSENSVMGWLAKTQSNLIKLENERKLSEVELTRSETKFRTLFNTTSDAILMLDEKRFFDCNPAALDLFGLYSQKELRKYHPADLSPPTQACGTDSKTLATHYIETAVQSGTAHFEWIHKRADSGEPFFADISLNSLRLDGKLLLQTTVRDISERKKREQFDIDQLHIMALIADISIPLATILEAIVKAVQRYEPALLGSILLMDEEGKHLKHGAAPDLPAAYCEAIDGIDIGPSIGSCGTAAFTGEQVIVSDIAHDPLWADFKDLALQYELAACWSQPIKDAHNQVLGTFAMYYKQPRLPKEYDIKLLLQAEALAANAINSKKAHQMRVDIQSQVEHMQRLESLGVLAGGIAHDFNNILTAILGNAAMAERKALLDPHATQGYLNKIVTSSERAADLCKQMLAYSGKGKFEVRTIDLSNMVEEITNLLEISISKSVVLKYHLTDQLPAVEADAAQLQQVIMNLTINASDAIADKSGVISISTGVMHADRAYLSGTSLDDDLPEGRYVYLEVSDTGCGMDKETQKKVFEPFFTTKFTGHGLGMSAVLGIVRGHHGAIKLYSEVGRGTTFKVLLPISEQPIDALLPSAEPAAEHWHGSGTVLIVDDEETIREMASMMLEDMGFTTLTASDGLDGVGVYREHQQEITVVLMDMTMPKMDGKTCFTELRRINKNVKVLLSSGYNEQEAISSFAGQGLAGFIQKPYTPEALQEKLQQTIE